MGWITFLKVVAVLILCFVGFLYYLNFWDPQEARKVILEEFNFLYFEAQCSYNDIGGLFGRLEKELSDVFEAGDTTTAGMYFDDPNMVEQKHMTRSAIGVILLGEEAVAKARAFIKTAPRYKLRTLPTVRFKIWICIFNQILGQGLSRDSRIQEFLLCFLDW
jgi:hypothetical protein